VPDFLQYVEEALHHDGSETFRRLVKQDQTRIGDQCARERRICCSPQESAVPR
jgi:hypothetical protein